MKTYLRCILMIACAVLAWSAVAYAWEVDYQANSGNLPSASNPAWRLVPSNSDVATTVADGVLHIRQNEGNRMGYYGRESMAIAAGVPVTLETRMFVAAASGDAPLISIQSGSAFANLYIYTDHVTSGSQAFYGDFTTFRTIRLAYNGQGNVFAWVDGQLAISYYQSSGGGQNGISFGAGAPTGSFDSYWQYVSYSKQFLPAPEPSAFLALLAGTGATPNAAFPAPEDGIRAFVAATSFAGPSATAFCQAHNRIKTNHFEPV